MSMTVGDCDNSERSKIIIKGAIATSLFARSNLFVRLDDSMGIMHAIECQGIIPCASSS